MLKFPPNLSTKTGGWGGPPDLPRAEHNVRLWRQGSRQHPDDTVTAGEGRRLNNYIGVYVIHLKLYIKLENVIFVTYEYGIWL